MVNLIVVFIYVSQFATGANAHLRVDFFFSKISNVIGNGRLSQMSNSILDSFSHCNGDQYIWIADWVAFTSHRFFFGRCRQSVLILAFNTIFSVRRCNFDSHSKFSRENISDFDSKRECPSNLFRIYFPTRCKRSSSVCGRVQWCACVTYIVCQSHQLRDANVFLCWAWECLFLHREKHRMQSTLRTIFYIRLFVLFFAVTI